MERSWVHVMTILPYACKGNCSDPVEINMVIAYANKLIKRDCAEHTIVDMWKAFVESGDDGEGLYVDHYHPSSSGYEVLVDYVPPHVD